MTVLIALTATSCRGGADLDAVKARSHAVLEAFGRDDAGALAPVLGTSFVRFERGRASDRSVVLDRVRANASRHAAAPTRTWSDERVVLGDDTATFIGEAVERFPAETAGEPARTLDSWNTLVWVRERGEWKVAYWNVERVPSARESWNEAFREGALFRQEPNELLVATVQGRPPGAALDLAMGQGRNALFLASKGWKVTGIDISDEGLRIARAAADKRALSLETVEADMDSWDLGRSRWDLVTMIYAGADPKLVERVQASLRPGGLVVIEVQAGEGGRPLAAMFGRGFSIVRDEVVQARPDWGPPHEIPLVRFVARKD